MLYCVVKVQCDKKTFHKPWHKKCWVCQLSECLHGLPLMPYMCSALLRIYHWPCVRFVNKQFGACQNQFPELIVILNFHWKRILTSSHGKISIHRSMSIISQLARACHFLTFISTDQSVKPDWLHSMMVIDQSCAAQNSQMVTGQLHYYSKGVWFPGFATKKIPSIE